MIDEQFSTRQSGWKRNCGFGFTLIELVVAIAVIGLLLGAIMTPLATQFRVRTLKQAEREIHDVKEALIGFAMTNGRLPCPDTDTTPDGLENTASPCAALEGFLPWVTVGVDAADTWGRLYRYRVTAEFANAVQTGSPPATPGQLDLTDAGDITVFDRAVNKSTITLTATAPAVVVSLGANGYGGRNTDGDTLAAPTGADELENTNGDANFIRRSYSPGASGCSDTTGTTPFCEYDDLVTWIPASLLKSHLVNAGRLP